MPYWTEERIAWYQRAITYCHFDAVFADALEPYLQGCQTICDLACGTGYLGMELARRGYQVSAIDQCETAIAWLAQERSRRSLSMEVKCADWSKQRGRSWDCVIMSMAGLRPEELGYILSLCRRRLILAIRTDSENPRTAMTEDALRRGRYVFQKQPFSAELGQPFLSEESFRAYVDYFHWSKKLQTSLSQYTAELKEFPMYLPLQRNLMLYVIETGVAEAGGNLHPRKLHTLVVGASGTNSGHFLTELLERAAPEVPCYGYHSVKEPPDSGGNAPIYLYPVPGQRTQSEENLLGWCKDHHATTRPEVFDHFAQMLKAAPKCGILLLDELGSMETQSPAFCDAVMSCLDGDTPVVAAVRDKDTRFLNAVRTHPKAQCFFLTQTNRQAQLAAAEKYLKKQLSRT